MNKILTRVEGLIISINNIISEYPANSMLKIIRANLEMLKNELSQSNPDREKILHADFGLLRAYEEISEFENTPFGKELDKLLLELRELRKEL